MRLHLVDHNPALVGAECEALRFLIVAPTMPAPEMVSADHSYRAMRAVLRVAGESPEVSREVFCPGLGTGVCGVAPVSAAREMAQAYADWKEATPTSC